MVSAAVRGRMEDMMDDRRIIAIVDDSPTFLGKAKEILSELYQVRAVASAKDLFELLKSEKPDLILLDVIMPVMDGNEAAKLLKSNDEYRDIPIIFLTGLIDIHHEIEGFANGAVDYIHKPFDSAVLLRRIQTHLSIFNNHSELKKEKSEALQVAETKSEILSFMSHEIRSPLTAVIGMLGFAKSSKDPVKIYEYMNKAYTASKHILELINDVLDISKIDADMLELTYQEIELAKMLQNIVSVINIHIENKGQQLIINIDKNVPLYIISDELRLAQILINLLSNAVKFTPDGGTVVINIRVVDEAKDEVTLEMTVEDNGIGISKEQQKLLFTKFRQASADIARKYGGTGLGLVISKRIVELMGGRIWVESEIGKGTKFKFTIKTKRGTGESAEDANRGKSEMAAELNQMFDNYTALIAEDDDINREIILKLLEPTRINVQCAENGAEAVRMVKERPDKYDIIFMDVHMPVMNGYDAAIELRKISGANATPIIAITAGVSDEDIQKFNDSVMDARIKKPYDFEEIITILNEYLC